MLPSQDEIVAAVRRFWEGMDADLASPYPYQDEELRKTYSEKEIFRGMEKYAAEGVLDYGVSVRTAWVVEDQGKRHGSR